MKTIVWKTEDITKRSSPARVLRVSAAIISDRSTPRNLGSIEESYQSEAQMLMQLLEKTKALPRAAFARAFWGGTVHMPHTLEAAGFARCYHL